MIDAEDAAYADLYLLFDDGATRLDLAGKEVDANGCTVTALADGTQFGNREPLTATLTSMLRDGDLIADLGSGNRKPTITLQVDGPNLGAVAATEESYQLAMRGPGLLVWQPPDPSAEPCVFECLWFDLAMRQDGDWDVGEMRKSRVFNLRIDALPFARSLEEQVAILSDESAVVIDDGSALTGWAVWSGGGSLTTDGSAITYTATGTRDDELTRTGTVTFAAGDYLRMTLSGGLFAHVYPSKSGAFGPILPFSHMQGSTAYYGPMMKSYEASVLWLRLEDTAGSVTIDQIEVVAGASMGRQAILEFIPGGSAPTYGTLEISTGASMGPALVHSGPAVSGFSPSLSPYESGSRALEFADATSPSGKRWALHLDEDFAAIVPASHFLPDSSAVLWARVSAGAAGDALFAYSLTSYLAGAEVAGGYLYRTYVHTFAAADTYELIPLGVVATPPTRMGADGSLRVAIQSPNEVTQLHDAYLCPIGPEFATTAVDATGRTRLWIDAPSVDDASGSVWLGSSDRDSAFHAGPYAMADEVHTFTPDGTRVFVLSEAEDAQVTARWHSRNHHHITRPRS